jgi:hypothetical protein
MSIFTIQVCSWNSNADSLLKRPDFARCMNVTLGVLASDIVCLQETVWPHDEFLEKLKEEERYCITVNAA